MTPKTLILTMASIGVVTGGGITGVYFLTKEKEPTNIREKLISERLTLLSTEDTKDDLTWKKLIKKYVATTSPVAQERKITTLKLTTKADTVPNNEDIALLKKTCKDLFDKPITSEAIFNTQYSNTKDWCTLQSEFNKG